MEQYENENGKVGFNTSKVQTLINNIVDIHTDLKTTITSEWGTVKSTLQKEWVGEDEQRYEEILIRRICGLYSASYVVVRECAGAMETIAAEWAQFQELNVQEENEDSRHIGGISNADTSYFSKQLGIVMPEMTKQIADVVTYTPITFAEDTNRGLASSSSGNNIRDAISTYVANIEGKVDSLFEAIKANSAFFGTQRSGIDTYIQAFRNAFEEFNKAVRDLYAKIEEIEASYTSAETKSIETVDTATGQVESGVTTALGNLDDAGSSGESVRWGVINGE